MENPIAFPRAATWSPDGQQVVAPQSGMSLRDYFAGQSLAILADSNLDVGPLDYARKAYLVADAMLAERERKS